MAEGSVIPNVMGVRLRFLNGMERTVTLERDEVLDVGIVVLVQHQPDGVVVRSYFVYEPHQSFRSTPVFAQVQAVTVTDPRFDP